MFPSKASGATFMFETLSCMTRERPCLPQVFSRAYVYLRPSQLTSTGQYCETVGWVAIEGIENSHFNSDAAKRARTEKCVKTPTRLAIPVTNATKSAPSSVASYDSSTELRYARRYLDWNRLTFEYHANGSQSSNFDTTHGRAVTDTIYGLRRQLNLSSIYGCVPMTYCESCKPFGTEGNIFTMLETALAETVVNESRADLPRMIIVNTGSVRYDLPKGPFTYGDSFTVIPFLNPFAYLAAVPYEQASVSTPAALKLRAC